MRHLIFVIGFLGVLFFSSLSFAQGSESDELLELLSPLHSLKANFVQTILDAKGKILQKSTGKLLLMRPGHFRWEIQSPVKQLIISNSTRIWIYDPDLEQVVVRPVAKELGKTPAFLLSNVNSAINKDFTVQHLAAPPNWRWFSLTPKEKDSLFSVIQLGFMNKQIKELRMRDNLGHNTVIQLKAVKENETLDLSSFQFHPPKNVDVIDEAH